MEEQNLTFDDPQIGDVVVLSRHPERGKIFLKKADPACAIRFKGIAGLRITHCPRCRFTFKEGRIVVEDKTTLLAIRGGTAHRLLSFPYETEFKITQLAS